MDRLERLINLTAALIDTERPLTRHEIQERVPGYASDPDAFRRAFERDKDTLRTSGVPISVEKIEYSTNDIVDGYRIRREEYELPDPGLTPDELRALDFAVAAVQLSSGDASMAIKKLGGTVTDPSVLNLASLEADSRLTGLFEGLRQKRVVRFSYNETDREVEPHRLSHYRGKWYISGFDRFRNDLRSFRVDRMGEKIVVSNETFEAPRNQRTWTRTRAWQLGDEEPVFAELLVDHSHVEIARSELGRDAEIEQRNDGSAVFRIEIRNNEGFRTFVLDFLEHVEVLSPPTLRKEIISWLESFTP